MKTEEVNNLKAIMKARAATTEVSVSSLRSKLEGQSCAYHTELTKLKYQQRMLKKEREEQHSQRMMCCEDFSEEITKTKSEMEGLESTASYECNSGFILLGSPSPIATCVQLSAGTGKKKQLLMNVCSCLSLFTTSKCNA